MRRTDKEVKDPGILEEIITSATVLRLAMFDEPYPYLVPVSFGYRDGVFFFHSAPEGRKVELLKRNNRVGFEVEVESGVIAGPTPCKWSVAYASVIGTGRTFFIEDQQEKWQALELIFRHYSREPFEVPLSALDRVALIRIEVTDMTGKKSPRP